MRLIRKIIELSEIEDALVEVDETLSDLNEVRATLSHDVHFGSIDLHIEFGSGDIDEEGAVAEMYLDLDEIASEEQLLEIGLERNAVLSFFDADLLAVLLEKQISLSWNVDDPATAATVDLFCPGEGFLQPMDM